MDSLPVWWHFFSYLPAVIKVLVFFNFYYRIFPTRKKKKKRATSAPPGVDLDAGSTSGSLQLSPTFSWLFTFCSGEAIRHLFLSVVFCLLLAIAPTCQSKGCVCYVIRGARARTMNKHQCGYAGSGKNEADMWAEMGTWRKCQANELFPHTPLFYLFIFTSEALSAWFSDTAGI